MIEEKAERVFQNGSYEWKHEKPSGTEPEIQNKEILRKVMDFCWLRKGPNAGIDIKYPEVYNEQGRDFPEDRANKNDGARHIWYMTNKGLGKSAQRLQQPLASNQALYGFQK